MPDMGLYYFKSQEAHKNGDPPSGMVDLLGVTISTEEDKKTGEKILVLDSDFREIKCVAATRHMQPPRVCLPGCRRPAHSFRPSEMQLQPA